MTKFQVGDRVKVIGTTSAAGRRYFGRVGTITKVFSDCCNLDLETEGITGGFHYYEVEPFPPTLSLYSSLRSRIEAINGSTTLQEFGELLLEVGEQDHWLNIPTAISKRPIEINTFSIKKCGQDLRPIIYDFTKPCDAIPALKKCFMYLLDNHPTIKKDDKQEKIEALQKEQLELKAKLSILDHKIEELQR